jgi:hypothetical protein
VSQHLHLHVAFVAVVDGFRRPDGHIQEQCVRGSLVRRRMSFATQTMPATHSTVRYASINTATVWATVVHVPASSIAASRSDISRSPSREPPSDDPSCVRCDCRAVTLRPP